jgi:DNA replicative helicase MCM subunit Mcm2 (Cdc46/Mcm family)
MTYAVVGCTDCNAFWVVEGRPETTKCPRCERRHQWTKLKKFVQTDDEDHAREVRASILANRAGHGDTFADVDDFATLDDYVEDVGMDDETFLESAGVNVEEVDEVQDRVGQAAGGSLGKREAVRTALRELDEPTEREVKAFAAEHGVDGEYVERALAKLARAGELTETADGYRLL